MFFDSVFSGASDQFLAITLPTQRIFWLYLLSALVLAAASFLWFRATQPADARPEKIDRGLLGYIFDREVFTHRSAIQDYMFFAINAVIYFGIVAQLLIGTHLLYEALVTWLHIWPGKLETPLFTPSVTSAILYTLVAALAIDFSVFITHYLQHKVKVLWEFHQVHHSAEVLTPLTLFRMHPVDLFFTGLAGAVLSAGAFAGYVWMSGASPEPINILGLNVVFFAFYIFGYNLRHSHIWLAYPRWVSYILISPAQHQTHHSIAERHWDRNFGLIFSFWDWMFGTLYVPKHYEKLEFGVSPHEPNPFSSVSEIYLKPFRGAWALLTQNQPPVRRLAVVMLLFAGAATYLGLSKAVQPAYKLPSVHLTEMTWTEVALARNNGFDRLIVPTAGVEQNGPHVVLGKHGHVVRHTAGEIAREIGNTLVAPVVDYVPEGATGPEPDGHMRYPGTISVPEPVFEAILKAAVESAATHGFASVYLIGDSGGNQASQARVAAAYAADSRVEVHHVADYYGANGQVAWLKERGFSDAEIGTHAGIRDTSELLAVAPRGVRRDTIVAAGSADTGANGAADLATAEIGEAMLALKVKAAVAEIRALETARENPAEPLARR